MQLVFVEKFHPLQDVLLLLKFLADTKQDDLCGERDQQRWLQVDLPGVFLNKCLRDHNLHTVNQGISAPPGDDKVVCTGN